MLTRVDSHAIANDPHEIRLFCCFRNERARLPFFIDHYRKLGVGRFFLIDNASTDGSADGLRDHPDIHVFHAAGSYREASYGIVWVEALLRDYGVNRWCVTVDADEFLVYPGCEDKDLRMLAALLEREGSGAVDSILLDMYPRGPISAAVLGEGQDPVQACPYFETRTIHNIHEHLHDPTMAPGRLGGMRERVFSILCRLDKISFLHFKEGVRLARGMHAIEGAAISRIRAATLHFKYLRGFAESALAEIARGEHWSGASEYRKYSRFLQREPDLSAFSEFSIRYSSSRDLVSIGLLPDPWK